MTDEQRGIVKQFGPDPSKAFYKLWEEMLWSEALRPLPKLLLIDFLHRAAKGQGVPSISGRAGLYLVSDDSIIRAQASLEAIGCLIVGKAPGVENVYLACFPPIPVSSEDRSEYEKAFQALVCCAKGDHPQNAATPTTRKMRLPPPAKCGYLHPQNAGGPAAPSTKYPLKTEKDMEDTRGRAATSLVDDAWGEFTELYPDRDGGKNLAKGKEKFKAFLKGGVDPEEILAGTQRYRSYCDHAGLTGTPYVRMVTTFLNQESWREEWAVPAQRPVLPVNGRTNGTGTTAEFEASVADLAARTARSMGLE